MSENIPNSTPPPLPGTAPPTNAAKPRRGLVALMDHWKNIAFANSAVRREAKALLFAELAEATRQGMPLDVALSCCMRTQMEVETGKDKSLQSTLVDKLLTLVLLLFLMGGGLILLMFTSGWAADVERVARVMARRLHPLVTAGHTLADAMAAQRHDYTTEEIETVRAGEYWGKLPTALDRLARFQMFEHQLQRNWSPMALPLMLALLSSGLIAFMGVFVAPKMKDIYDQLGAELPGITQLMVDCVSVFSDAFMGIGISFVGQFLLLLLWIVLWKRLMVGNMAIRNIVVMGLLIGTTVFLTINLAGMLPDAYQPYVVPGFIVLVFINFIVITALLYFLERVVLAVERGFYSVMGNLPFIGAPKRTELESRWLGALSMALSSGSDMADAVESAGNICGNNMRVKSVQAAAIVRQGYPIGDAVVESRVIRSHYAHRLRLLDGRAEYLQGLEDIAEDAALDTYNTLNRVSRVCEVASIVLLGVVVLFVVLAMYMPLFNIPQIVGVNY